MKQLKDKLKVKKVVKQTTVEEPKKQNRLYLADVQKKKPVSFSATKTQTEIIKLLVDENRCKNLSDMIIELIFNPEFRKGFKDSSIDKAESLIIDNL